MTIDNNFFKILQYRVSVHEDFQRSSPNTSDAVVKVKIWKSNGSNETTHVAAEGIGPINALDSALRKALAVFFPKIARVRLTGYDVHIKNGGNGSEALVEVTVTSSDGENSWQTKATSVNIITASLEAISESLERELLHTTASAKA